MFSFKVFSLLFPFCLSLACNSHWAFCLQPIKTGLISVLHRSVKLCSIYQLVTSPRPQWIVSIVLTLFCSPLIKWSFYLPYHQRIFPWESLISVFCFNHGSRKIKSLPFHLLILNYLLVIPTTIVGISCHWSTGDFFFCTNLW